VKNVTTYVGIDAHKKDLFVAMLIGREKTLVTWQLANEPNAIRRLVRKVEREAPGRCQSAALLRVSLAGADEQASEIVQIAVSVRS
jgi:hypothetical protein